MANGVAALSEVHKRCLRHVGEGYNSKEIAARTNLTHRTVDQYIYEARRLLGAPTRGAAARILREFEAGEGLRYYQLISEPVAGPPKTAIVEKPADPPKALLSWWKLPSDGGSANDLTHLQRLAAIAKIALFQISCATAIIVLARAAFIALSHAPDF